MENTYLILSITFLLCLLLRTRYESLKEAGKINPESKLIFGFIFTAMCTLWVSWFSLCPLDPYQITLPDGVRWIGFALFIGGMFLAVGAFIQLRGVENIDHLVTNGLFSTLRHPMYTGFILWILGWCIYYGAAVSFVMGLIGIVNILYWRRLEDVRLAVRYGETYLHYRMKTWF